MWIKVFALTDDNWLDFGNRLCYTVGRKLYKVLMRRIFNYRPVVIFCLLMISSVLIAVGMQKSAWYCLFLLLPIAAVVVLLYYRKSLRVLYYLIAICVGFSSCALTIEFYNNQQMDGKYIVTGRVSEVSVLEKYSIAYLTDAKAEDLISGKTKSLPGTTSLYVYANTINVGDHITMSATIKASKLIVDNKLNVFIYRNNVKYSASLIDMLEVSSGKLTLSELIRFKSKAIMQDNLSEEVAGVTYAVLFGDKTMIDDNVNNAFKDSGTIHLLAVSGLHVGFLITLLYLFFSLIKLKKWYKFGAMIIVLACYSYMCGFSPSVLRASIMGLTILLANNLGKEKDRLSSVALSAVLILTFRPLYLFDYGFLLSYGAVLGILFIARPLTQLCGKNKITKVVVGIVAVCICAQLGVLPVTMSMGELPTYSILANVIVVPLFGIAYMVLCVINLIVLIMPFMKFLFVIVEGLFGGVVTINAFVANLPGAIIKVFSCGIVASILFYILILFISKYTMLKTKLKVSVCCILAVFCVTIVIGSNLPARFDYNSIVFVQNNELCTIITTQNNETYLIGLPSSLKESEEIEEYIRKQRMRLSGIVVLHNTSTQMGYVQNLLSYNDGNIILPSGHNLIANVTKEGYALNILDTQLIQMIGGISVMYIANEDCFATQIGISGKNVLYLSAFDNVSLDLVKIVANKLDYIIVDEVSPVLKTQFDSQLITQKECDGCITYEEGTITLIKI